PVLAETGNAGEYNALVRFAQRVVVDAETALHVGTEIFHHHVGFLDHAHQGGVPQRRFQIECHAAYVAYKHLEVGTFARATRTLTVGEMRRRLDLDDVGAPVGELAHAGRARSHARQIED